MINKLLSVSLYQLDQHVRMISCPSCILDGRDGQQKKCCKSKESAVIRVLECRNTGIWTVCKYVHFPESFCLVFYAVKLNYGVMGPWCSNHYLCMDSFGKFYTEISRHFSEGSLMQK